MGQSPWFATMGVVPLVLRIGFQTTGTVPLVLQEGFADEAIYFLNLISSALKNPRFILSLTNNYKQ